MTDYSKILKRTKVDDAISILLRYTEDGHARAKMRRTLADLRRVDTNSELKKIIKDSGLSLREVADLTMVSYDTAAGWTVKRGSSRFRRMPNRCLALLRMSLGANAKKKL